MADVKDIQSVIIIDNKNAGNYTKMIDVFKPKEAKKCYISVSKFEASIDLPADYDYITHNVILSIQGSQNTYVNDPSSGIVVRSQIIDSFMTSNIKTATILSTEFRFALYSAQNNIDNWVQVSMSDLNSFRIVFKTASNQIGGVGDIQYSDVSNNTFQFFLHLRVKFE